MEKVILKSYSYLMNSCYERIAGGKSYDISFKPYEKKFVNKMIKYFEEYEEYEKCDLLMKFINDRFDHEKNYATA
jgi:hypothetical protein